MTDSRMAPAGLGGSAECDPQRKSRQEPRPKGASRLRIEWREHGAVCYYLVADPTFAMPLFKMHGKALTPLMKDLKLLLELSLVFPLTRLACLHSHRSYDLLVVGPATTTPLPLRYDHSGFSGKWPDELSGQPE